MISEDQASSLGVPNLSSADIIKLQAATFLSVCTALDGSGMVSFADMATILVAHADDGDRGVCAQIIRAIVVVLERERAGCPRQDGDEQSRRPPFTVIQGG